MLSKPIVLKPASCKGSIAVWWPLPLLRNAWQMKSVECP